MRVGLGAWLGCADYFPQVGQDPGLGAKLIVLLLDSMPNDLIITPSFKGVEFSRAFIISATFFFSIEFKLVYARMKFSIFRLISFLFQKLPQAPHFSGLEEVGVFLHI